MKKLLSYTMLCLFYQFSIAQSVNNALPAEFQKKLDEAKMTFVKPEGATEIPVIKTEKVGYDYAIKLNAKNVEIRYAVRPISKEIFTMYENRQKKEGDTVLNPNIIHRILTPMMYSRISGGKISPQKVSIQYFKPESIKTSAGADVGTMSSGPLGADWAQTYNFGFYVMLHKEYLADAYIFYLFEDEKQMVDAFKEITANNAVLYALKFK
ncbi:hypothetical protein ACVWYN_002168 [Pedobacter sp. UYP24]